MSKRTSDVIVIGGGIIGVSLALEWRRRGASVRVLERGEPGREASWAGAGMLAARDPETPECLRALAAESAKMYPEWVAQAEEESGLRADLRLEGTIYLSRETRKDLGKEISVGHAREMEPLAVADGITHGYHSDEGSVDPRALMAVMVAAAKKSGVLISHEHPVSQVRIEAGAAVGVMSGNQNLSADVIINCAGAWAGEVAGVSVPSLPVKGQMLSVVNPHHAAEALKYVVRGDEVYVVPRSDGRILIGATVEHAGFDKRVVPETILRMRQEAEKLVPKIAEMRIHESWAGLRPGTPDKLPILGATGIGNYFVATGHYRNGILLAPVTARVMADIISGDSPQFDVSAFSLSRFAAK